MRNGVEMLTLTHETLGIVAVKLARARVADDWRLVEELCQQVNEFRLILRRHTAHAKDIAAAPPRGDRGLPPS
jgi:hypothetical protein